VNGRVNKFGAQVSGGSERNQYFVSGDYNHELGPYKMPQTEISRLEKERGAAVPYNEIFPNADARANLRANLSTQLGSKADFNIASGYLARANRQPQNEDNSVGLMVDALGGLARTDLKDSRGLPLNGYRSYPMGDVLSTERNENINRFTQAVNARYYPFAWLNTRANLGFDYTLLNVKNLTRFDQGPFGETSRQGSISDSRTENSQYTLDVGATGSFNPRSSVSSKSSVGLQYYRTYNDQSGSSGLNYTPGATQVSSGATQSATSGTDLTITLGTYGEQVFSFRDRLFLTGRVRYDGNSSFGKSFKGVFYPGVGLSWLVSDENFFPHASWFELVPRSLHVRSVRRAAEHHGGGAFLLPRPRRRSRARINRVSSSAPSVTRSSSPSTRASSRPASTRPCSAAGRLSSSRTTTRRRRTRSSLVRSPSRSPVSRRSSTTSVRSGTREWKSRSTTA
jgi:hypothetical protein